MVQGYVRALSLSFPRVKWAQLQSLYGAVVGVRLACSLHADQWPALDGKMTKSRFPTCLTDGVIQLLESNVYILDRLTFNQQM